MRKVVALLALLIAAVPGGAHADNKPRDAAVADYFVKAGAHKPGEPDAPYTYTKFYPSHLRIHAGKVVAWEFEDSFAGLHTVTFGDWDEQPAIRADEVPGTYALNERGWIFGNENRAFYADPATANPCGRAGRVPAENRSMQDPCEIQPGGRITSGLSDNFFAGYIGKRSPRYVPYGPFRVKFPSVGFYKYACRWHPGMQGSVDVVADDVPVPSQAQIDDAVRAEIAADTVEADAAFATLQQPKPPTIDDTTGTRVWTVQVGGSTPDDDDEPEDVPGPAVNFLSYFPSDLPNARPGDRVRFVAGGTEGGHTVSFPAELQGGFNLGGECSTAECTGAFAPYGATALTFSWGCDTDGRATGSPALVRFLIGAECPNGSLEWQLERALSEQQRAPEDVVATPTTWHNSAWMVAASLPSNARAGAGREWPSEFEAAFPVEGSFTYACLIHPQAMAGSIRVT